MRLLILGGSSEASGLAKALAADTRFEALLSLAGRTSAPRSQPIPVRTGGFGGAEGLAHFLRDENIDLLIDATHPFAARMSCNAIAAAAETGVPFIAVERPPWMRGEDDLWVEVPDVPCAVAALGPAPRIVFSAIGSLLLRDFEAAPQHRYVVRLIDRPARLPDLPRLTLIQAQGPFTAAGDAGIFREHGVDVVIAKNSGGGATVSKIEAARMLHLPVMMVSRPSIPARPRAATVEDALTWLDTHYRRSMERGV
jgi:precorrin-6A/cobalt-precorrin-6A reductase